jgi:hypothetical protein
VTATTDQRTDHSDVSDSLVEGLKTDRERDTRSCRQDDCHGELTLTDDERVICQLCRCTPDGVYLPPDDEGGEGRVDGMCVQYKFFHPSGGSGCGFSTSDPKGSRGENGSPERYDNSGNVRLPGGVEAVYDEDDKVRPRGVTDEYTFDLSTL